jgi:hypothetical protein
VSKLESAFFTKVRQFTLMTITLISIFLIFLALLGEVLAYLFPDGTGFVVLSASISGVKSHIAPSANSLSQPSS